MKTSILKISGIIFLILLATSCKEAPKEKTDGVEVSKSESKPEIFWNSYKPIAAKSSFSTKEKNLIVTLPLKRENLQIHEAVNVSSTTINAIVIRVTDDKKNELSSTEIDNRVKSKTFEFSAIKGLELNADLLKTDGKLLVYVLNTNRLTPEHIESYKKCVLELEKYEYIKCIKSSGILPDEEDGDILTGG
ncbi:MAG: hypothetical protein NWQ38_13205 [Cellulophaga sp.]|nr:hypothetical protein [Cellulophaga sp.]